MKPLHKITILVSMVLGHVGYTQQPEWQWVKSAEGYDGANNKNNTEGLYRSYDWAKSLAVLPNGSFYIAGTTVGNFVRGKDTLLRGPDGKNLFVEKLNSQGKVTRVAGVSTRKGYLITPTAVYTDLRGNVAVTGWFNDTLLVVGHDTLRSAFKQYGVNFFLIRFREDGQLLSAITMDSGGLYGMFGTDVTTDLSGNVYVTGQCDAPTLDSCNCRQHYFLMKFDKKGSPKWMESADDGYPNYAVQAKSLAADKQGNVYVCGWINGKTTFGPFILDVKGGDNLFIVKYDTEGKVRWAKTFLWAEHEHGCKIVADPDGNCYISANWATAPMVRRPCESGLLANDTLIEAGNYIAVVAKLDASGSVIWKRYISNIMNQGEIELTCLALDAHNNLYGAGYYPGPYEVFDKDTLFGRDSRNSFVEKFDTSGNVVWITGANDNYKDGLLYRNAFTGLGVDKADNVYVTGYHDSPVLTLGNIEICDSIMQSGRMGYLFVAKLAQRENSKK